MNDAPFMVRHSSYFHLPCFGGLKMNRIPQIVKNPIVIGTIFSIITTANAISIATIINKTGNCI